MSDDGTTPTQQRPLNIYVAALIAVVSPDGPRVNAKMFAEDRAEIESGIWLCESYAKLANSNPQRSTIKVATLEVRCRTEGRRVLPWLNIERPVLRKLAQLNWSAVLEDLKVLPGNNLEALKGDRKGQHSIHINDQWRLCSVWTREGAADVERFDYH